MLFCPFSKYQLFAGAIALAGGSAVFTGERLALAAVETVAVPEEYEVAGGPSIRRCWP